MLQRSTIQLISTEGLSTFSSQLFLFSLPIIAVSFLKLSDSQVGLINTSIGIGTLIFLLFFGPLCDIRKTHLLLSSLSLARCLLIAAASYMIATGILNFYTLAIISFFIAGLSAIYESAISAYIPKVIPGNDLHRINSWIAGLRTIADIATGSVAGILLSYAGASWSLLFISIAFLLSCLGPLSFNKKINKNDGESNNGKEIKKEFKSIFSGFKLIFEAPAHRKINIGIAQFNFFTSIIYSFYVIYCIRYADMSAIDIGISGSIGGVIGLIGILLSDRLSSFFSFKKIMFFSLFVPGVSGMLIVYLPIAFPQIKIAVLSIVLGVSSICVLVNISIFETYKQKTIEIKNIGKYSAASRCITWGIEPLGSFIGTLMVYFLPLNIVLILACLGVTASPFWLFTNIIPDKKIKEI
ncbi:hypothetical protein KSP9073_00791 [Kushneria phyllosphaerae]|uniref:Major facilitator superfamily (MFS) profile domain-containing protein n=2 Tax=Kushneria phyllosphaerae TaxID=2100822 RepID=A0A2R8CIS6_9GAMM|nr:hypothetical protein KSP9073_00791 [Kushneria phyllosphaerae]